MRRLLLIVSIGMMISAFGLGQKEAAGDADKEIVRIERELEQTQEGNQRIGLLKKLCSAYLNIDLIKARLYAAQEIELNRKIKNQKSRADFLYFMGGVSDRDGKRNMPCNTIPAILILIFSVCFIRLFLFQRGGIVFSLTFITCYKSNFAPSGFPRPSY